MIRTTRHPTEISVRVSFAPDLLPPQHLTPLPLLWRRSPIIPHHRDMRLLQDMFLAIRICISIGISKLLKSIHLNIRALPLPTPRGLELASRGRDIAIAGAVVCSATAEAGQGKERTKSMERASDDPNSFLNYGPEADFAGAEHEFCGVAIET